MTELHFLKTQAGCDMRGMPGKDRQKIEMAVHMCRVNGPVPAELLQVGLMILRSLSLEKPVENKQPFFWTFLGFVEWINACSPEEEMIRQILFDLRTMMPSGPDAVCRIMDQIAERDTKLCAASIRVKLFVQRR